jgi:hypothetical protein
VNRWLFAAAIGILLAVGAVLVGPRLGPSLGAKPEPPDPAAFAGDPRVSACMGDAGSVEFVFVMPQARDYQRHLPAMLRSPELEVDDPGFVVIFAEGVVPAVGGVDPSDDESGRYVCISVDGQPSLYSNVDITGMRVDIGTTQASATPTPGSPTPSPSESPTPTPQPAAGLSEAQAVAAARSHLADPGAPVWSTRSGPFSEVFATLSLEQGAVLDDPQRPVWGIAFHTAVEICGPPSAEGDPPRECETRPALHTVYLDFSTGEFLRTSTIAAPTGDPLPTP